MSVPIGPLRLALFGAVLGLPACAAEAPPPPAVPPGNAAALPDTNAARDTAAPATVCEAVDKPHRTLRRLAALVSLGRSMPIRPAYPDRFVAELEADAARATALPSGDPALAKLTAETSARLGKIAAAARALAAKKGSDGEAVRAALLEEMERGELVVLLGEERCGKTPAGRHSAAALESTAGRISGSVWQRAVRAGNEAWKRCHEAGLRRDPSLRGAVRVRFVVAPDGTVAEAVDIDHAPPDPLAFAPPLTAAPLRDAAVSACVVEAFRKLSFPKPEGGAFSAIYAVELGSSP
ncbi:Hypothetical protein A7982_03615 [Minicystis rosea]|nr:Hypothetical protein A7982_03615 [Minicystis rosea]